MNQVLLWGNIVTAVAYYILTAQLVLSVRSTKFISLFQVHGDHGEPKKRELFYHVIAVAALFATFICMCGNTHTMHVAKHYYPQNKDISLVQIIVSVSCAAVSILTAIVGFKLFPAIIDILKSFELDAEGNYFQHSENYLIEAVELIKESIMILSETLEVIRGNEASKLFFGAQAVGTKITEYIHPSDLSLFHNTVNRVMSSYNLTPSTIELRIKREPGMVPPLPSNPCSPRILYRTRHAPPLGPAPDNSIPTEESARHGTNNNRVHCGVDEEGDDSYRNRVSGGTGTQLFPRDKPAVPVSTNSHTTTHSANYPAAIPASSTAEEAEVEDYDFVWIEVTLCKGARIISGNDFEYDVKMIARNVEDRKKRAQYQSIIEGAEEKERLNESKLRYISCIAHDLKTPLQSFSFTLDLLGQTKLHPEQRDFVQQATVAVDLMKLTISQTMDISKALSGGKLLPRRTTVYLSSVMQRVKVIINGYGKQVPVSFEVAPEVCDTVITDEEWLWQMLLNLLTNACKYTDRGGIAVKISLRDGSAMSSFSGIDGPPAVATPADTSAPDAREKDTGARSALIEGVDNGASARSLPLRRSATKQLMPTQFTLTLPSTDATKMLLCEVIDTGIGISLEKMPHIFDAFAQVQDGQVTGTGLGLFGVRMRAEGLGGCCGARQNTASVTGTGTVLWFAIPYVPDTSFSPCASCKYPTTLEPFTPGGSSVVKTFSDSQVVIGNWRIAESEISPSAVTGNLREHDLLTHSDPYLVPSADDPGTKVEEFIRKQGLTAMVVEDTLTVRKLMEKVLLRMGFARVDCYENGSKGLDAMMAGQVDIVFSDVQMPIMTGPEMIARYRKFEAEQLAAGSRSVRQLVVAVTANGAQNDHMGAHGFDEVCPKPLNKNDIYHIVTKHILGGNNGGVGGNAG